MRTMVSIGIVSLTFAAIVQPAPPEKVAPALAGMENQPSVDVIIRFAQAPAAADHALVRRHGGTLRANLPLIDSAAYSIPGASIAPLAADARVVRISPDGQIKATMDVTAQTVGATTAGSSNGLTGANRNARHLGCATDLPVCRPAQPGMLGRR